MSLTTRTTESGPQVLRRGAPPAPSPSVVAGRPRVRHRAASDASRWLVPVLVVGLALLATVCAVTVLGLLATHFG
jgi:hypothetical protein